MRKSRINLIINRRDYQKYENYFQRLRIFFFVLLGVFFITFITFTLIINTKTKQEKILELQKTSLLEYLRQRTNDSAKVNYIEKKYNDMKTFLKDDAYSSPYYRLLSSAIEESSEAAYLKSFDINKDRDVSFTIQFSDFIRLTNFFRFIESDTFSDKFEKISLKSFSLIGATDQQKENYELSFQGRFLPLEKINSQKNEDENQD